MADHRLKPLSPLGHANPLTETIGPVSIAEITDTALASLATRIGHEDDVARLAAAAAIPLPGPGGHVQGAIWAAFWLAPQHWMIEAPFATHEDIAAALRTSFAAAASVTEQTDAWARFDVTAPDLPAMFERLTAFDLRGAAPGSATRTVIDHLGCYVIVRNPQTLTVLGPRSSAQSLHHALVTAARSAF